MSRRQSRVSVASFDWENSGVERQASPDASASQRASTLPPSNDLTENLEKRLPLPNGAAPPKLCKRPSASRIPRLASLQQLRPTPAVIEAAVSLAQEGDAALGRGISKPNHVRGYVLF